jgi:hypothetical protein
MIPATNKRFLILLLLGLGVRILTLPMPGTEDMLTNQIWGARTVEQGITRTYILDDTDYLTKAILFWRHLPYHSPPPTYQSELGTLDHVPNYPPLSVYSFWLSTWIAKLIPLGAGRLQAGGVLNACFNVLPLLGALGIVVVTWSFLRAEGAVTPWWAVTAFWLNPVMLLHSPVLGYVDSVFTLFGFCSLWLLYQKRFTGSVIFLVLSCLTKPQGVLILPVVLVAVLAEKDWRLFRRASLNLVLYSFVPFLPFILAGYGLGALRGTFQVVHVGYLSSNQTNLWWIVSWVLPALPERSFAALTHPVIMRQPEEFHELFALDARRTALLLLGVVVAISVYFLWNELQRGNRLAIFWAAALQVYFFTMLALHPHENHLYPFFVYALPMLVLGRREFPGTYVALSLVFGLNIFLFDGFGRGLAGAGHALRTLAGFDLTVLVAFINLAVFVWLVTRRRWLFELTRKPEPPQVGG